MPDHGRRRRPATARPRRRRQPEVGGAERWSKASAYMPWRVDTSPSWPVGQLPNVVATWPTRRSSPIVTATTVVPAGGPRGHVELAVAEPVDPQHLGVEPVGLVAWQRHGARHQQAGVDGGAELGRGRRRCKVGDHGANTSRPGERRARRLEVVVGLVSSTARSAPPTMATAGASSPLSGPTSTPAPPATSIATPAAPCRRRGRRPPARRPRRRRGSRGRARAIRRARRTGARRGSGRRR